MPKQLDIASVSAHGRAVVIYRAATQRPVPSDGLGMQSSSWKAPPAQVHAVAPLRGVLGTSVQGCSRDSKCGLGRVHAMGTSEDADYGAVLHLQGQPLRIKDRWTEGEDRFSDSLSQVQEHRQRGRQSCPVGRGL